MFVFSVLLSVPFYAQADDPVVMNVNGTEVRLSEFEYFFKKNNTDSVITKKTINQYADLCLNLKLKVQAAISKGIDTTAAFREEFKMYRDMQAADYLIDNDFIEQNALEVYQRTYEQLGPEGLVFLSEIKSMPADDDAASLEASVNLMNTVYEKLLAGEDFGRLAREYSNDDFAADGGQVGWISKAELPEEIKTNISFLRIGGFTEPFVMNGAVYIMRLDDVSTMGAYVDERASIINWLQQRTNIFDEARFRKGNAYAAANGWNVSDEAACVRLDSLLEEVEPEFGFLSKEIYEGLLVIDASLEEVWNKVNDDPEAMNKWFENNRKLFKFNGPRYKGMVFFCTSEDVFHELEALLDGVNVENWVDTIIAYNKDDIKARVMTGPRGNGIFREGDNAYVDNMVFGTGAEYDIVRNFPYVNVMGRIIDKPESVSDVQNEVSARYQTYLEQQWIKKLRKQYKYKIYRKALKKVSIDK